MPLQLIDGSIECYEQMDINYGKDFYPEPFPEGLFTIELGQISLAKLLEDDQHGAERLFKACTHGGFCYIDLTSHPKGVRLFEDAHPRSTRWAKTSTITPPWPRSTHSSRVRLVY